MQNNLDKYIEEVKIKLDKHFLSPLFIRYANLLYMNEQYEDCIGVCKTGLKIYPNYLTSKLILLKALLKAEYLNEADIIFKEIRQKIVNKDLLKKLELNFQHIKSISRQEKIYYSKSGKNKFDFKSFEKKFDLQEDLFSNYTLDNFFNGQSGLNEQEFQEFSNKFESFHFDISNISAHKGTNVDLTNETNKDSGDLLNKIRIVTETLADLYCEQGNYKEAFDAYNVLIRAGSSNKKRIEEKLYELERTILKYDTI